MINQNEVEEIISLINNGTDLELLSFELDIPMEQLQSYKKQLELRKFVKASIKNGTAQVAIEQLNDFIEGADYNIVERMMLLKLKAYMDKINVSEDDLREIEEERKKLGLSKSIDEILEELEVQIPKRKNSNLRKKEKQDSGEQETIKETPEEVPQEPEKIPQKDYEEAIKRYKKEIARNPQTSFNKRNLLAFAYFKAGRIDEARDELLALIDQYGSYTAYRQLIHLEKSEGNFEDAKLWAYDCLERFPSSIDVRKQLISIAKAEKDTPEVIKQLREIISIHPESKKSVEMLEKIKSLEDR